MIFVDKKQNTCAVWHPSVYMAMAAAATVSQVKGPLQTRQQSHGDVYRNPCATGNHFGFGHRGIATALTCRLSGRRDLEVTGKDATKNVFEPDLCPLDSWIWLFFLPVFLRVDIYHSKSPFEEYLSTLFQVSHANLRILLVLNVEIVVPTADQYAKCLGASESFSGAVIALTPVFQGIIGVSINYSMLSRNVSRWWFQTVFGIFTPNLFGEMIQLVEHIFQMG